MGIHLIMKILISENLDLGHITKLNQINKILREEFYLLKKRRILTLSELTIWKVNDLIGRLKSTVSSRRSKVQ